MTAEWAREFHQTVAERRGLHLSDHEIEVAAELGHHDFKHRPYELLALHHAGQLTGDLPTYLIPETWRYRLDTCTIPIDDWRDLFATTRYTRDFALTHTPRWPLRLYRGSTAANREGISWTTRLDQAIYFARFRQAPGTRTQIWTTTAPPSRLYAFLGGFEQEHVLDARGLPIRHLDPRTRSARAGARLPTARPWAAVLTRGA